MKVQNDAALRRYLLGMTSSEESEAVELWLMSDEDAYDLLEAAEDDLIDDALSGQLSRADRNLFENHFLAAPERQRKYQFSRSLKRVIATRNVPALLTPSSQGFINRLL